MVTPWDSSLSTLISCPWENATVSTHSCCARGQLEHLVRSPVELADSTGDDSGEPLLVGRKPLLELRFDVDVCEQRVDQRRGDLFADGVVDDQLVRSRADGVVSNACQRT